MLSPACRFPAATGRVNRKPAWRSGAPVSFATRDYNPLIRTFRNFTVPAPY